MNWETYKTLNKKQKEEYDYKYKDKNFIPNISKLTGPTVSIMLIGILLLMQTYLIQTDDRFIQFKPQAQTILESVITLLNVALIAIVLIVIAELLVSGLKYYKRYKWYKDNNINIVKKQFFK